MKKLRLILGLIFLLLSGIVIVSAQSVDGYNLTWNTIDGGGGSSNGGTFTVSGTIGQPDPQQSISGDGRYQFNGGFWGLYDASPFIPPLKKLFLPLVTR